MPSLGGQPAFYVTIQLLMFREKLWVVEPMNADDERTQAMTIYAAWRRILRKLPPPEPADGPMIQLRMERARTLIEQHRCNVLP